MVTRGSTWAALLGATALAGASGPAWAQAPAARPAAAKPAADPTPVEDEDDETTVSEFVVTASGERVPRGSVVGDIAPEEVLGPAEIQSYGVSNVQELLDELAPEISSGRGRGGEAPVVLLNGRRISGLREIRDIPTEAIIRTEILPEEVALKYGYSADQKVVNIVLRRRFRATTGEVGGSAPTQGGQASGSGEYDRIQIRGDNRLHIDLKASASSSITEAERDLTPIVSSQRPFDVTGNVESATPGAVIDPLLPVTVAGVPAGADARAVGIADFLTTPNPGDERAFRTLTPATQKASANVVLARAFANGASGSLNGAFEASRSEGRRGLPGVSLTVPAGDPFSPFASDIVVDRFVTAFGPLRQESQSWSGHLGGTLNKDITPKWRLNLTGSYDHGDSESTADVGVDASALQAQLLAGAPDANPFGALGEPLVVRRAAEKATSNTDTVTAHLLVAGPTLRVPAGQVFAAVRAGGTQSWFDSESTRFGAARSASFSRSNFSSQANIDVPIAKRRANVLPFLGDLSVNGNAAVERVSDFGTLTTLGYGMKWAPRRGFNLIVSHTRDEAAPTQQQLGAPVTTTEAARIFDFATGQTVDVRRLDGGNPLLKRDQRNVTKVGLTIKPLEVKGNPPRGHNLTFTAQYVRSRTDNPIETFPAATAEIEAAFPDRFLRNAEGELVQVDFRPVNFASASRDQLRIGFHWSRPIGPQPQSRRFGPRPSPAPTPAPREASSPAPAAGGAPTGPDRQSSTTPAPQPGDTPPPRDRERASRGGPGGFGGRRGGFGGGGRLQLALFDTIVFKNTLTVRDGGPVFDLLHGSAAGDGGGQPQHVVQAQAGITQNGLGARLSASWQSATDVKGAPGSPVGDLHFGSLAKADVRLFANFGQMKGVPQKYPWLRGARLTLAVSNIFDERQDVRDATGKVPVSYQPDYLDPQGRTIRVSFRKLFF